jgi:hypothetical protein
VDTVDSPVRAATPVIQEFRVTVDTPAHLDTLAILAHLATVGIPDRVDIRATVALQEVPVELELADTPDIPGHLGIVAIQAFLVTLVIVEVGYLATPVTPVPERLDTPGILVLVPVDIPVIVVLLVVQEELEHPVTPGILARVLQDIPGTLELHLQAAIRGTLVAVDIPDTVEAVYRGTADTLGQVLAVTVGTQVLELPVILVIAVIPVAREPAAIRVTLV